MKRPVVLLVGSLAVNAALLAALVFRFGSARRPTDAPSPATAETAAGATNPHAAEIGAWTALRGESSDAAPDGAALSTFARRLREAGFPPQVVRLLVEQAVREQFAERRRAVLAGAQVSDDFWSVRFNSFNRFDAATRTALREISREERRLLREALGDDYEAGQEHRWAAQRRYFGNFSSEKLEQLQEIMSDYADLRSDLMGGPFTTVTLPEDREKLTYLEREMRRDIAALLTPEELADYDLHTSRSTWTLRTTLGDIDLSEEEFRTVHRLQKTFDDQFTPNLTAGQVINRTPEFGKQRAEAEKSLVAEVKALLGEPRASDYERSRDYNYRSLEQVTDRLGLPKQTAIEAYALQKDIQERATKLRSDRSLSTEQRTANLTKLAAEASASLTTKLGADGFDAYKRYGGQWIERLVPRPASARPPGDTTIIYRPNN